MKPDTARAIIDTARRRGFKVHVVYVYRDPDEAARAVVQRAAQAGRIVPPDALAKAHYGANETIRSLKRQYKRDAGVVIHLIRNTADGPVLADATRVPVLRPDEVATRVREAMSQALEEADHNVRQAYERFLRSGAQPEGPGQAHRPGAGEADRQAADMRGMRAGAVEPGTGEEAYRFGGLSEAAQAEVERLSRQVRADPSGYSKALSAWKSTKTVFNPPSWVRKLHPSFGTGED